MFFLLRQIKFVSLVALYLPGHVPKILEYPGRESSTKGHPKNPTLCPGVHLCRADIPLMRQKKGIKLFFNRIKVFFSVKPLLTGMLLPHFPTSPFFVTSGFVAKPLGIPWYLLVELPRELNLFFSPTTSLSLPFRPLRLISSSKCF